MSIELDQLKKSENIAELLSDKELANISQKVLEGYKHDEDSRQEWKDNNEKAMKIAKQVPEHKTYPWKDAADIKYPLITQATIDFAAREYPEIIQSDKVVKATVIGKDLSDEKFLRTLRVSRFMSFQLLNLMDGWEEGVDKLLHMLPVLGTVFKKTYYDDLEERVCSDLCHPDRIVVNYKIQSLKTAKRITHVLLMSRNAIVSRIRLGIYSEIDIDAIFGKGFESNPEFTDEEEVLEQCCYLDLDDDGYEEPYIVTLHKNSGKILKIINRFKKVNLNKKKQVVSIDPKHYYTAFHFIMSPDGGFYSIGLGTLLLPLNCTINSLLNQLVDSGTLNNTQGGFFDSRLRMKPGDFTFKGGEFKQVQVSGMNKLQDYVMPLPTKEPSQTLFQLLGLLITASKDLVSNTDILKGKGETQNVPATTTMAMIEQGLKIYNAITKRLFLSLSDEYKKIFELNQEYLSNSVYKDVLDDPSADVSVDFNTIKMDVLPVVDPAAATQMQRVTIAQSLLSIPGLNPYESTKYYLQAMGLDDDLVAKLLPEPDPQAPPPPEVQKTMAEAQNLMAQAQKTQMETQVIPLQVQLDVAKGSQDAKESDSRIMESQGRIGKMYADAAHNNNKLALQSAQLEIESNDRHSNAVLEHASNERIQELKKKEVEAQTQLKYQELLQNREKKSEST